MDCCRNNQKSEVCAWFIYILCIVLLFNAFSSPWPINVGAIEVAISVILIIALWRGYFDMLINPSILSAYIVFILWMTFLGVINNELSDVIRDTIPFLYIGIPLASIFYLKKSQNFNDKHITVYLFAISISGLILAVRSVLPFFIDSGFVLGLLKASQLAPHIDYLFLDPAIIFGSIFFLSIGLVRLNKKPINSAVLIIISFVTLSAPFIAVIRAPVFLYLLSMSLLFMFFLRKKTIILLPVVMIFSVDILNIINLLVDKQANIGSSAKLEEVFFIFNYVYTMPFHEAIFGTGAGASYYSPILNTTIRFAHSLPMFALLKGGLILLIFSLIYILYIGVASLRYLLLTYKSRDFLGYAAILSFSVSFLVNTLLEPGFKTLSYGLLLIVFVYFVKIRGIKPRYKKI